MIAAVTSGCMYELRDEFEECHFKCAAKRAARAAWSTSSGACQGMGCPNSFKDGFIQGYLDVANGGKGCVPIVPVYGIHNHMWMDRCSDNDKAAAWFDGFEIGVMAARADGMADANRYQSRVPTATADYSSLKNTGPGGTGAPGSSNLGSPLSDPAVPPTPVTDDYGGPQTRR